MSTNHTPGPWVVNGNTIEDIADRMTVATITDFDDLTPRQDANAALIAAAPDLLAALQYALERFECIPAHRDEIGLYRTGARLARAAIAKATGA